ncbi:MAG: hypothetical protein MSH10_02355 [Pygmaiobacter massiliensis]|nr:hypothetical protein [Pygmaiobacter massiliensis]
MHRHTFAGGAGWLAAAFLQGLSRFLFPVWFYKTNNKKAEQQKKKRQQKKQKAPPGTRFRPAASCALACSSGISCLLLPIELVVILVHVYFAFLAPCIFQGAIIFCTKLVHLRLMGKQNQLSHGLSSHKSSGHKAERASSKRYVLCAGYAAHIETAYF